MSNIIKIMQKNSTEQCGCSQLLTGQFTDKPNCGQSSRRLVQLADWTI